jgi:hypothetical protein
MKFREKYAVKIDLRDAISGGVILYFTVYLLSVAFGSVLTLLYGIYFPGTNELFSGFSSSTQSWVNQATLPFVLALTLTVALMTFLTVVLTEEHHFSKHEKTTKDLLGLGLVWGTVFVTTESIMNLGITSLNLNISGYSIPFGVKAFTSDFLFWPMVVYIAFLPWLFHYSKKVKERGR